jgi:predicted TIM-barrel fold metal-dependent hydrolase
MLSRRDVLTTTVAAGAGLAMAAQAYEPAKSQLAGRIIVDAQVHIWLANTPERPWPADGVGQEHIPRPFSYYELSARMDEAGVDRVVLIPPSWEGYHNEYAMEAAKKWPHRFAVMGRLRLDDPKSKDLLATWKDQPGMLGVRHTFNRLQSGWLTDGTADWFWPAAAKAGIPVMTPTAGRARDFLRIVERNPDLVFIIDHMNLSDETAKQRKIPEAIAEVVEFAKYPNVQVKMSSVPHKSSQAYPFRDLTEHIKRVFDAFGPRRSFWGTDLTAGIDRFPNFTYQQRITHFTEELPFLTEDDKDWVMGRAIMRRLGWT